MNRKIIMRPLLLCSLFFIFIGITSAADPTITVAIGSTATITGYELSNPDGYAFYGIPYAQPPTGQNRFAPTVRKDPLGRILAFHFGPTCVQDGQGNMDEDCLFINIVTPKMTNFTANQYPVLFCLHGGAFVHGSGNFQATGVLNNLVSRGVIVVSINYRLGIFGFFSSRDSTVPGNMAILDQMEAINWVRRYISYFGGDPNAITIAGQSAGGESASLLTISPLSKGLFKQAIIESATAFSPSCITYSEELSDSSKQVAIKLGCATAAQWDQHNDALMAQMLQCMQSKTAAELQSYLGGFPGYHRWAAVQDKSVFPDRLERLILQRPPIPVLIGVCNNESIGFAGYLNGLNQDPDKFVSQFTRESTKQHYETIDALRFYNNSGMVLQQLEATFIDNMPYADQDHGDWLLDNILIDSDCFFIGPIYREAMNFRYTNSPVYLYSFDYLAPGAMPWLKDPFRGVTHAWEVQYLFGYPGHDGGGWQATSDDIAIMNYFGLYWTNFVKFGNPTPPPSTIVWPRLGTNSEYLKIGPVPTPLTGFHPSAATFWGCTVPTIEGYKPAWCP